MKNTQVKKIINEAILDFKTKGNLDENSKLDEDLGINTFDLITMVESIKKEINIDVSDEVLCEFVTVKDLIDYFSI